MQVVSFGTQPFRRGTVYQSSHAERVEYRHRNGSIVRLEPLTGVVVRSQRPTGGEQPSRSQFVAIRSAELNASGGSYLVFLGASLEPLDSGVAIIEVVKPEHAPAEFAEAILSVVTAATVTWDCSFRLTFDHGFWHQVDGKMIWFKRTALAVTRLLKRLVADEDLDLGAETLRAWEDATGAA